jgi:hypothetical protein
VSSSLAIQVADEVKDLLNAGSTAGAFGVTFTAVRRYIPRNKLEDLTALTVTVVPASSSARFVSRAHADNEYAVDVGVQKRLAKAEDTAEIDALTAAVDAITAYLASDDGQGKTRRLLPQTKASLMRVANNILHPDHLREEQVFTCVLTLTYELTGAFR